ncbi:MAG: hypothetical protein M3440_13520 [Chloroflexota bacterium]|nr:hypothetical protein [Chloroflexota bacterium]
MTSQRNGVAQERTGWRDEKISLRHRDWGLGCPAIDLDFVLIEYSFGQPVALVEYKHFIAQPVVQTDWRYNAHIVLANNSHIPFFVARYWPDVWAFQVVPFNPLGEQWFEHDELMTERQYVRKLYAMRGQIIQREMDKILHDELPSNLAESA